MDTNDKWNKFMTTGSVRDYLLFKEDERKSMSNVYGGTNNNESKNMYTVDNSQVVYGEKAHSNNLYDHSPHGEGRFLDADQAGWTGGFGKKYKGK